MRVKALAYVLLKLVDAVEVDCLAGNELVAFDDGDEHDKPLRRPQQEGWQHETERRSRWMEHDAEA